LGAGEVERSQQVDDSGQRRWQHFGNLNYPDNGEEQKEKQEIPKETNGLTQAPIGGARQTQRRRRAAAGGSLAAAAGDPPPLAFSWFITAVHAGRVRCRT